MNSLYIYYHNAVHKLPVDSTRFQVVVHACFVSELDKRLINDVIVKEALKELKDLSKSEKVSLDNLVPAGNPFLVDTGHNYYTWPLSGKRYTSEFNIHSLPGEILISPSFIGSSSHVYVPMLPFRHKNESSVSSTRFLPKFLINDNGFFTEAEYNFNIAKFVPVKFGTSINPESLKLLTGPASQNDFWQYACISNNPHSLSSLTCLEVEELMNKLKCEHYQPEKLNRYLLVHNLETQSGSFIVGKIFGDNYTVHLPYVPVEIRK
jgi:hypothetical protein